MAPAIQGSWLRWRGSSGAPDPGGPQALAGPPALLDSAGRSGLLRCASARPPLTATNGLDSGDGRSASRSVIRVLGREPQPHARTTTTLTPWTLARVNLRHVDLARHEPVSSTAGLAGVTHRMGSWPLLVIMRRVGTGARSGPGRRGRTSVA